ncbi:NIPA-like protein [Chionoecetes opilio]|uniref:NIPA-like protein n=1 Tax=Chionoecetes opilio TaxID=41210 RepID=A0A8J5CZJ7_CHIOP|nr:NIPA-like protein [Chionoecetes opilio]
MADTGGCTVISKIEKISQLLGEVTPKRRDTSDNGNAVASPVAASPPTPEAFYERLASFGPGLWRVREVTPLECARYGWKLIQADVVQCVTCRQVVCCALPLPTHRYAYSQFLERLKSQVVEGHHDACWWRHNPSSPRLALPSLPATYEDLHNLVNTAHILEGLESALPRLDIPALMTQLDVDDATLGKLHSRQGVSAVQITAALLTLSGWTKGAGEYLRCKGCCRSVGLWSFVTQADGDKPADPALRPPETPSPASGRHRNRETESSGEESGVFASPEKHAEPEDTQAQWRMRLRERRVSEQSSGEESHPRRRRGSDRMRKGSTSSQTDAKEEPAIPLVETPPPAPKVKPIPKQPFHPLEEHRPWCPWLIEEEDMGGKGYARVLSSVKQVIRQAEGTTEHRDSVDGNVHGVRFVRTLLGNLGTDEYQPME